MREDKLREILRQIGLADLSRSHSGWLHGPCPLAPWTHRGGRDKNPSFAAKVEESRVSAYMCFSCKAHGRISGLVRTLHHHGADVGAIIPDGGEGYPQLAHDADKADYEGVVARDFGETLEVEEQSPDPLDENLFVDVYMPAWQVPEARAYLESRGIGEQTASAMELGWDPDQRRIMFPVRDRAGALYGHTGRAIDPDVQPRIRDYHGLPKRHLVLNEHRWTGTPEDRRPLIIVEGLFGLAALIEMGVEKVADIGCLMGSSMSEHKATRIRNQGGRVYLLLDNDDAGEAGIFGPSNASGEREYDRGAISQLINHAPLYIPAWPEGKSQPDDLTRGEMWSILKDTPMYPTPEDAVP